MDEPEKNMNQDHADIPIPPPMIYLAALGLGAVMHYLIWPLPLTLPDIGSIAGERLRTGLGILLVVIGVFGSGFTASRFKLIGDSPMPTKPTSAIITTGPYSVSRNPLYLFVALVYLGIGLSLGSLWIIIMFIPLIYLVQRLAIIPEEQYLESKFGDQYLDYKAEVRRWI